MSSGLKIIVNGSATTVYAQPDRSLLEVLREDLGLTGSKYGCGEGQCGACTVLIEGRATRSCITEVGSVAGKRVTTIEGLSKNGTLHPVQQAFVEAGAMQCGYCTVGMIMTAVSLLDKEPRPSPEQISKGMEGNLCRCCTYPRIVAAVSKAASSIGNSATRSQKGGAR